MSVQTFSPPPIRSLASASPTSLSSTLTAQSSAQSSTSTAQSSAPSPANAAVSSSSSNAGTIAGSVVGGVVGIVLLVLATLLYLRARKRNRTPPSSEFMNSLRDGAAPVLRLDSGAQFSPALPEKAAGYPPAVPLPLLQNSYYTTEPQKFPDDIIMTDIPSARPSVEGPLQPLRYSSQANDIATLHNPGSSVGSRRELWGSDTDIASSPALPIPQSSPHADSALRFASQFSFDEQPLHLSHSPTSLQPLRRQPD